MARRKVSRQKKTATWLALGGVVAGAAAYLLLTRKKTQTPVITSTGPSVKRSGGALTPAQKATDVYTPGSPAHDLFTAAQDAWYKLNPDEPFINDDGSCNILPGYADNGDIPGCLNQSPPSDDESGGEA